ncbi:MAG TPA: DUF899 domain-containing protein [Streptosporangiaceae bacterium]|nr:DUF899 domain-containing protein [Streptosporangiaceae bacterium]
MSLPEVTTREKWLAARKELLAREKAMTRQRDALNADRRRLPMVEIDKDYVFEGPGGTARLGDLFGGSRQLIIQHIMFGPDWEAACPGCTAFLDELAPAALAHIRSRDTAFAGVSRAPLAKIAAYRASRRWQFDWYSSYGSDFNYDFQVTIDPAVAAPVYNYEPQAGKADPIAGEMPGFSCFLRDGGRVYHTYSTFARGADQLGSSYSLLDLTAFGRSEVWEEPEGRAARLHEADPTFSD